MLRDEIALFTKLSGCDGEHTPIGVIGAYLDGYEKGCEDAKAKYERPKGKWIKTNDYVTCAYDCIDYVKCSRCKNDSLEEGDYCPNCGADMREADNDKNC